MSFAKTEHLDGAELFVAERLHAAPFRFLRAFTRCSEEELRFLVRKIFTESTLEGGACVESPALAWTKSLLHPFYYLLTKKILWRAETPVLFDLETIDRPYFDQWFSKVYAALPAPKRITPRLAPEAFDGEVAAPIATSIAPRSALMLFLAPLFVPALWAMSPRANRPKFLAAFRQALGFYAIFDGHFRRYPCRHFITYADESNYPSRYISFKQSCAGRLVVVQNGERTQHPVHAFGMLDDYLVFGEFCRPLTRELRMKIDRVAPVGALCLNEFFPLLQELEHEAKAEIRHDILFVDQSLWPENGMDRAIGESLFKVFANLNRLKGDRPELRLAYQLRNYGTRVNEKRRVIETVRKCFPNGIEFLENAQRGDSYRGIFRSRLTMTVHSTLGIEAFFFGRNKKALFVNYSGGPFDLDCPDERFVLADPSADYGRFKTRVDELLRLELAEIPQAFRDRHFAFDGKVQERIADFVNREVSPL